MKKRFLSLLLIVTVWLSCSPTEPQNNLELRLIFEDASCTEAWITVKTTLPVPAEINLRRTDAGSNSKDEKFYVSTNDTLLYIDSLLTNQTYKLQVSSIQYPVHSNEISITTLDTTNSNFTFTTWTFGGTAGSSSLYDVAIINENNIWAVGEIYVADTSENGYTMYNAVHWDGNEWELKRIMFYTICGQQNLSSYPAKSIFAFSENEIWIAGGGRQLAKVSGTTQIETICPPFSIAINKIWGTSSKNLYVVGINGTIAHYNGSPGAAGWTRIESGTSLHIYDIWGGQTKDGDYEILCVASNFSINQGKKVLLIKGNNVIQVRDDGLPWSLSTVWFIPKRIYFIAGDGFYSAKYLGDNWIRDFTMPPYYKTCLRGVAFNDIIMVGSFGLLMHYNGVSWKNFQNITYMVGAYGSIAVKNNIIAAVGLSGSHAILTIGKR